VPGIYRPRHPERTALYRVLFHSFDRFLSEYERRFEKEYGYFRPVVQEVVERYLDCGNPRSGFARIRCPDCHGEHLLTFSCKTRGFCPSCHAKRLEEWGEWVRETLLLDVPHRPHLHLLLTEGGVDRAGIFHRLPRLDDARLAEIFGREVLALLVSKGLLSPEWAERVGKCMVRPVMAMERLLFLEREGKVGYRHGQNGAELETMDYLEFIARVTSHIPDKGQVMVRYYGLYANAHRGKVRKAGRVSVASGIIEEEPRPVPSKGWAEMIRKVYEVDPLICPRCGGRMKVVAFLTEYAVVDRIIRHLELTFVADGISLFCEGKG